MGRKNQSGFSVVEILLVIVILGIVGFTGYFVYHSKQAADKNLASSTNNTTAQTKKQDTVAQSDASKSNVLTVQEWGLQFTIPQGLTDVQYAVFNPSNGQDATLAVYAKPAGANVEYIKDYKADYNGLPKYAIGTVYRTTDPSRMAQADMVEGKKVGDYYYYTAWSFSSLATGAGCNGLYGNNEAACSQESKAFALVNTDANALLPTIRVAE